MQASEVMRRQEHRQDLKQRTAGSPPCPQCASCKHASMQLCQRCCTCAGSHNRPTASSSSSNSTITNPAAYLDIAGLLLLSRLVQPILPRRRQVVRHLTAPPIQIRSSTRSHLPSAAKQPVLLLTPALPHPAAASRPHKPSRTACSSTQHSTRCTA